MTRTAVHPGKVLVCAAVAALAFTVPGQAAQRTPLSGREAPVEAAQAGSPPYVVTNVNDDADAQQTREKLDELLTKYPPALGRVLKLDPSLMNNPDYLRTYPAIAAFLAQHPGIAHNPGYFLEHVNVSSTSYSPDPHEAQRRDLYNLIGGFTAFLVFLVVTGVIVWLIRMVIAHRRWNRLSKIQVDVHTKLLDRFTSNEDLLAYVQTPGGRKFLESAPIPLQDEPRSVAAPFSRILWSVQAGVVLAIAGAGLLFVSARLSDEAAQFFMVVGVLTVALGAGFVVSAIAAYGLSRKLGLLDSAVTPHA